VSRLSRQCGILNIPQPYRPSRSVTRIDLLTFTYLLYLLYWSPSGQIPDQYFDHDNTASFQILSNTGCGKLTSFLYEYNHIKKEVRLPHSVYHSSFILPFDIARQKWQTVACEPHAKRHYVRGKNALLDYFLRARLNIRNPMRGKSELKCLHHPIVISLW
jgi:hypothetical protein